LKDGIAKTLYYFVFRIIFSVKYYLQKQGIYMIISKISLCISLCIFILRGNCQLLPFALCVIQTVSLAS